MYSQNTCFCKLIEQVVENYFVTVIDDFRQCTFLLRDLNVMKDTRLIVVC